MARTYEAMEKAAREITRKPESVTPGKQESKAPDPLESKQAAVPHPADCFRLSPRSFEEYSRLKNSLVALLPSARERSILFCGAGPEDGASTIVRNFALFLSAVSERVLLVEANLHTPCLHVDFGFDSEPGLRECLDGRRTALDVVREIPGQRRFSFMTCGRNEENQLSLFDQEAVESMLQSVKTEHDWVLLNAPPLNRYDDATVLAAAMDGAVLVVRAEKTRLEVAQNAKQRLEEGHAKVLGVVFNGRKMRIPGWIYRRL